MLISTKPNTGKFAEISEADRADFEALIAHVDDFIESKLDMKLNEFLEVAVLRMDDLRTALKVSRALIRQRDRDLGDLQKQLVEQCNTIDKLERELARF